MTTDYGTQAQLSTSNKKLLEEFGQTGAYILSSETQNQLTKSNEKKKYNFIMQPTRNRRQIQNQPYESDINSEESQRILQELKSSPRFPDRTLLDIQSPIKSRPIKTPTTPKKGQKHATRTAPAAGFKSLYQLSLMLGKGFNIDDLYLVQDSFSKEDLNRNNQPSLGPLMPFTTVNPPVTVVPLKPQIPSTRFEPLPTDYIATIKPLRKDNKEKFDLPKNTKDMFDLRKEARAMFDLYTDNDLYDEYEKMKNPMDPELIETNDDLIRLKSLSKIGSGDLDLKFSRSNLKSSISLNSSRKTLSIKTHSTNSISSLSKCGLLSKDIYDLSDEESTPGNTDDENEMFEEDETMCEPQMKMKDLKMGVNQVVMFNVDNDLPSSRESTKANASLSSRVGLDDVNSDHRSEDCQMQSSERAHPLCNTVTPGTVMKTYARAIGKDFSKATQRSHTFSGLESKNKKGKDRSAMSFPTIFKYN